MDKEKHQRFAAHILDAPVLDGNRITAYNNGDEIFPAIINAISSAKKSITFSAYIFWAGDIGFEFTRILSEKAREGVRVHLLLDWLGSRKISTEMLRMLKKAGVEVTLFNPPTWRSILTPLALNRRTHRKIIVIDGRIGFTGGICFADYWLGNGKKPGEWRDSHFQITGPAVAGLQTAFLELWMKANNKLLQGDAYFPPLEKAGSIKAQVVKNSYCRPSCRIMYLMAIAAAEKRITISTPYFLPDVEITQELLEARRRGVEIEIVVSGDDIDHLMVQIISKRAWGKLLEKGVRIFEYLPTMLHLKAMTVDGCWSSIGSSNLDYRSLYINEETNLSIFDREFTAEISQAFHQNKRLCRELTYDDWRKRGFKHKIIEMVLWPLHSQL